MGELGKRKPEQVELLKKLLAAAPEVSTHDAAIVTELSETTVKRVRRELGLNRPMDKPAAVASGRDRVNVLLMKRWDRGLVLV